MKDGIIIISMAISIGLCGVTLFVLLNKIEVMYFRLSGRKWKDWNPSWDSWNPEDFAPIKFGSSAPDPSISSFHSSTISH
jgi:hypothetical protein